jgi:hypothetical protein
MARIARAGHVAAPYAQPGNPARVQPCESVRAIFGHDDRDPGSTR